MARSRSRLSPGHLPVSRAASASAVSSGEALYPGSSKTRWSKIIQSMYVGSVSQKSVPSKSNTAILSAGGM